jgi:hypothetical protein
MLFSKLEYPWDLEKAEMKKIMKFSSVSIASREEEILIYVEDRRTSVECYLKIVSGDAKPR